MTAPGTTAAPVACANAPIHSFMYTAPPRNATVMRDCGSTERAGRLRKCADPFVHVYRPAAERNRHARLWQYGTRRADAQMIEPRLLQRVFCRRRRTQIGR